MLNFLLAGAKSIGIHAHEEKAFVSWMRETNNIFTGDEYHFRLGIFLTNKRYIQEHNRADNGFKVGLNHLAHLTPSEYKTLLGYRPRTTKKNPIKLTNVAKDSVDWRTKGIVNEIKNQAHCGSCWAFSAIQCCESRWAQAGNKLLIFSEQNIVDCVEACAGCNGGEPFAAINHVIRNQAGKFNLESDYPYTAVDGSCKFDGTKSVGLTRGYDDIQEVEDELQKAVSQGVVSVCIDASQQSFHLYKSGVYYEPACSSWDLDHAVGCVGYGTEGSSAYWIVRNSWGTVWGEEGYIRMARNRDNNCGIASEVILPREI